MAVRQQTLRRTLQRRKKVYLYLAPTFLLLAIFMYYPPLSAFYHAFFDWDGFQHATFVGLGNFQQMAQDSELIASVPNMVWLVLASLITGLSVPLLVAELIFNLRSGRWSYLYRLLFVAPVVVPLIVNFLLWQFIYDPNVGLLDALLGTVHPSATHIDWLGDPNLALYALMFVGFPWVYGINVLIYLAGLQNMPESVLDAALLDGATAWRRLWYIDLPLLIGQTKVLLVLGIINGVQGFGLQFVLTQGGPGFATMVPGLLMYQYAFRDGRFGYGSAIGLAMFLIILAFTYLNMRFVRSSVEYEAS